MKDSLLVAKVSMMLLGMLNIQDANPPFLWEWRVCARAGNITKTTEAEGEQNPTKGAHQPLSAEIMRFIQVF